MKSFLSLAISVFTLIATSSQLLGQGPGGNAGGGGGGGVPGGGGGNGGQFPGGILISPGGLVGRAVINGNSASSFRQLRAQAQKSQPGELSHATTQRFLSLSRLDQEIVTRLRENRSLPSEIRYLAGLTRIDFVIIAQDDVILVGPASAFGVSSDGRVVSVETGRPVLCLDDLLVALRGTSRENAVGCSMDPDIQRVKLAMNWLQANSDAALPSVAKARMQRCVELQGEWNVTTFGVPETSRMCLAMVEADYLMKRIAIGAEDPKIRGLKSSLALARPNDNMMRRWWFAPSYLLERTADSQVYSLGGPRLQLYGREELIGENGQILDANLKQPSSEKFAQLFNERIKPLTDKVPALADLQNIFDILTAVAIADDAEDSGRLSWKLEALRNDSLLPLATYNVPKSTLPEVNTKDAGQMIIGAFSGGVTIRPASQLSGVVVRGELAVGEDRRPASSGSINVRPAWPSEEQLNATEGATSWWWDDSDKTESAKAK